MKNKRLLVLTLSAGLILTSCGEGTSSSSNSASSSQAETTSSATTTSSSSAIVAVPLAAPTISVNEAGTGLTWGAVEHASKYQVKVNDGAYADATDYTFNETVGSYVIKVKAIGDGINYSDSEEASYEYETKAVALSDLTVEGMNASWTATGKDVVAGFASDGDIKEADWAAITSSTYAATANGKLGVCVSGGYDATNKVLYVGEKVTKYVWIVKNATENKAIFDKDTDVVDGIKSQMYTTNGWADPGASSVLAVRKADIEESEESIDFKMQQLATAYKYGVDVSGLDAYSGMNIKAKGDGKTTLVFQIEGAFGYASYTVGILDSNWHVINIPFADEGWKVNGSSKTLASFALENDFTSAGAILAGCTTIDTIWKVIGDSAYGSTHVFLKEVALVAGESTASNTSTVSLAGSYTGKNGDTVIKMQVKDASNIVLSSLNLESNLTLPLTYAIAGDIVTLKSADEGASLTYIGRATNKGRNIAFTSSSGTYAAYLNNVAFSYVYVVDDFESYDATGVGYDKTHTIADRTGLRANYYADYYANSGSDSLSGTGWSLMGSSDYITLAEGEANAHSGTKSAKFKGGNATRYTSYNVTDGTALAYPAGSTFSFFAANPGSEALSLNVRLFTNPSVGSSDFGNVKGTVLSLPANSSWKQYTVTMDASKTYYGFSFSFEHTSNYAAVYPSVDDIEVYNDANPHAEYVDSSVITNGTVMTGSTTALKSVTATFAKQSTISVVAVDATDASHDLKGTYAIDSDNNITIDCGDSLVYKGVISSDYTVIKYTSATGTLATYVDSLFLETVVAGKTIIESFENLTETGLRSKYSVDQDVYNSGSFTSDDHDTTHMFLDNDVVDGGFASGKFVMDTTAAKVGKYRYRFATGFSKGSFSNFSIRIKNDSSLDISFYLYVCKTPGVSAYDRVQTSLGGKIKANTDWTSFSGTLSSAIEVYGYSLFFTATAPTTDIVTGFIHLDNVLGW
jgi:hypothetical protein